MSLSAEVKVGLELDGTTYNISLAIPTGNITGDNPYTFNVEGESDGGEKSSQLLEVAVGESDQLYVAVSPPESILELTNGLVKDLEVVVNEGGYDPDTHKFITEPNQD